jgi:hypothetical protein
VGLEALAAKPLFAADVGVRRALLRNPQLPAGLYRRLWTTQRMHEQHLVCINREVPEQTRRTARDVLRARFVSGPSEEKVELFVQNLARWSATPAPLIAHLLRQDVVKRNPMLRTLLERRPGV